MSWPMETDIVSIFIYILFILSLTVSARQPTTEAVLAAINVKALKGGGGGLKFGDKCEDTKQCDFEGSICDSTLKLCQCVPELPVTNHLDKCGKAVTVNESCTFNEQCEQAVFQTECRDGRCMCRFDKTPVANKDGVVECQNIPKPEVSPHRVDPTMIGILAGMVLMFIILCVVLRLFSNFLDTLKQVTNQFAYFMSKKRHQVAHRCYSRRKSHRRWKRARWRENRTIFNTPNPRLMNASLLQHNKSFHEGRRGSRASGRGPSRTTSVNSLRPHSPSASLGSKNGGPRSRCNSRDGNGSPPQDKSPTRGEKISITTLEDVKVETQPLRSE